MPDREAARYESEHRCWRSASAVSKRHSRQEQWRVFRAVARQWRDAVNRHGGDVTLVELPSIGIRGNTHFPMSDLNNVTIADLLSEFLHKKGLD